MASINIPISEDLKRVIDKYIEIEWTKIAEEALWDYACKLELMDKLTKDSKLTEEDAIEIGNKIKIEIAKRHGL